MTNRSIWPESWGLLYAAFAFSQGIGLLTYWTLPILAGSLITGLQLTTTEVGLLGTIEFAGLFFASLTLAQFIGGGHRKRIALISVFVVISLNVMCALIDMNFKALAAMRFSAGLGAGLALAIGNATIANATDTERFARKKHRLRSSSMSGGNANPSARSAGQAGGAGIYPGNGGGAIGSGARQLGRG